MLQAIAAQGVIGTHHASPPAKGTNANALVVDQILIVAEGDMLLHKSLQQRTVVFLHLGDMAEEEVMLVRN